MSIESSPKQQSAKPVSSVEQRNGKKSGVNDASGKLEAGGFSALMSLMSESTSLGDATVVDIFPEGAQGANETGKLLSSSDQAQMPALNEGTSAAPLGLAATLVTTGVVGDASLTQLGLAVATASAPIDLPSIFHGHGADAFRVGGKSGTKQLQLSAGVSASSTASASASGTTITEQASAFDVAALLSQARASSGPSTGITQVELRESKTLQSALHQGTVPDGLRFDSTLVGGAETWLRPQERVSAKMLSTQSGFEGLAGSTLTDQLGISSTYEVAAASAIVPDTQVAETVSYWVTHGVQSAELTLDGLGTEPVQVRISVEGDQAQIDFRSNQADVRQVLEDASSQLKAMLLSEGLQLSGMSVGTSGTGGGRSQEDSRHPKAAARQKQLSVTPLVDTSTRVANLFVGRSLDLYV